MAFLLRVPPPSEGGGGGGFRRRSSHLDGNLPARKQTFNVLGEAVGLFRTIPLAEGNL